MRLQFLLLLATYFVHVPLALVVVPHIDRHGHSLLIRDTDSNSTATEDSPSATTSATSTATSPGSSTSAASNTTVPTLNATALIEDEINSTAISLGALPLQPEVTPALGVGGFILLATGATLALIGVRNLWIQVFLSSAFLTSLGVTVLIVYVMSPPVRIAIQGAYLVAIFFTGVTFGGLAIVFKELAEGLGCLLGGFCTSMWLLSTKPGGLLTETGAKTGFIGAISVAFYAVSFSHYTRPYGLIAATSIAGGTAVSLGIDCYSKAGLKEFWLYLWALNDDIFPLGTNTYPVTRYIKVELAATVIIAIMGVISQLRLWRVVRERRAKEEERLQEEQKQKDEAEAEAARKLEEENLEERMEWEAKYGNPATERSASIPESTAGLQKCDVDGEHTDKNEVNEKESLSDSVVSYRCSDCRARGADGTTECSDAQSQKEEPESDSCADQIVDNSDSKALIGNARDDRSSDVTAIVGSESVSIYSKRLSILSRRSAKSYARPIAESQEALIGHDDASSTQGVVDETNEVGSDCHTIAAESHYQEMLDEEQPAQLEEKTGSDDTSEPEADTESRGVQCGPETAAARGSADPEGHQLEEKLEEEILEERALDMDRCEELPAASVEAGSPHGEVQKETPAQIQAAKSEDNQGDPSNQGEGVRNEAKQQVETVAEGTVLLQGKNALSECGEPTANDQEKESVAEEKDRASSKPGESSASSPPSGDQPAREDGQRFASIEKQDAPPNDKTRAKRQKQMDEEKKVPKRLDAETVEQIPKHTSRVIQTYRMNEWAKHLADADMPELEPIQPSEEKQPESPAEKEEAAPVKVAELLQTPLNAQLPPAVETRVSNGSRPYDRWTDSHRKKRSKSPSRLSGGSVGSEHSFQHFPPVVQPPGNIASSSSATVLPHAVSVEPARGESESKPKWKGPPPLIAVREDMMRSRQSLLSLPTDSYARHSTGSPTDFSPRYSSTFPIPEEDGDDIPLSQRRTMLHQSVPVATTFNTPAPPRWSHGGVPSRANSPAALAAWRESVREELLQERHDLLGMSHSAVLPGERRASPFGQSGQRNASSARVHIEKKIAERMQQGDMSELHREAMRQMQAKANQSVSRLIEAPVPSHPPPPATESPRTVLPRFERPEIETPPSCGRSSRIHRPWASPKIQRPPSVRLANPVNYVPRITPVTVPQPPQFSSESLPLESHRDAFPLLSIPERRRNRLTPSPNSLVVERSQHESESGRSSIAVPRQRPSGTFEDIPLEMETAVDRPGPGPDHPRHVQSQHSLRSQSQIASIPSNTGAAHEPDVAEELAWGPAHPCYPHINPHVPPGSDEYLTTRIIRIRRDWMVKGDLAPTFSNLYPEILDPLLPEQEFRRIIATINDELISAFDPFSVRNWLDGAIGLLTGWIWEDIGAPRIKSHLKRVEDWLERWNREVGAKDGVRIWSLRRTAYMSLDIQIPDPKVGIVASEGNPSRPGTRPDSRQ